jgi:hypothetical protein
MVLEMNKIKRFFLHLKIDLWFRDYGIDSIKDVNCQRDRDSGNKCVHYD